MVLESTVALCGSVKIVPLLLVKTSYIVDCVWPGYVKIAMNPADTGVTLLDAALEELVPTELVAVTVNVYAVPVVKPDTVIVPEPAVDNVPVIPPGRDVAV